MTNSNAETNQLEMSLMNIFVVYDLERESVCVCVNLIMSNLIIFVYKNFYLQQ